MNKDDPSKALQYLLGSEGAKYLIPQINNIVGTVIDSTELKGTQIGILLRQTLAQQIILNFADEAGIDIVTKYSIDNAKKAAAPKPAQPAKDK